VKQIKMKTFPENKELLKLTSKMLDNVISDEEHERLIGFLTSSPSNRRDYLDMILLESSLHWEPSHVDLLDFQENKPDIINFPFLTWIGSAAAVVIALFGVLWSFTAFQEQEENFSDSDMQPKNLTSYAFEQTFSETTSKFNYKSKPKLAGEPFLYPREFVQRHAQRGIDILLNNNRLAEGGIFKFHGLVKCWNRKSTLFKPAENGILPASGSHMIGFEKMLIDVEGQYARTEETVQVLDVRDALKHSSPGKSRIFAAVKFNQSYGDSQAGAEFGITLKALKENGSSNEKQLAKIERNLSIDRDPSTWNSLTSELEIPKDTEFIVVSLSARKHGPDALLANTCSYYSDDLELFLSFDDQSVIGPI